MLKRKTAMLAAAVILLSAVFSNTVYAEQIIGYGNDNWEFDEATKIDISEFKSKNADLQQYVQPIDDEEHYEYYGNIWFPNRSLEDRAVLSTNVYIKYSDGSSSSEPVTKQRTDVLFDRKPDSSLADGQDHISFYFDDGFVSGYGHTYTGEDFIEKVYFDEEGRPKAEKRKQHYEEEGYTTLDLIAEETDHDGNPGYKYIYEGYNESENKRVLEFDMCRTFDFPGLGFPCVLRVFSGWDSLEDYEYMSGFISLDDEGTEELDKIKAELNNYYEVSAELTESVVYYADMYYIGVLEREKTEAANPPSGGEQPEEKTEENSAEVSTKYIDNFSKSQRVTKRNAKGEIVKKGEAGNLPSVIFTGILGFAAAFGAIGYKKDGDGE